MLASEALEILISKEESINFKKEKLRQVEEKIAQLKRETQYDRLQAEIKDLEKDKETLGEKFMLASGEKEKKSFKVNYKKGSHVYEVAFLQSVRHNLTQKSLSSILSEQQMKSVLESPLIKIKSLKINIKKK